MLFFRPLRQAHKSLQRLQTTVSRPNQKMHQDRGRSFHHHGERLAKHYYSGGLATLVLGAAGGIFVLGYDAATGKLREKAEDVWQELRPPAIPGNVEMVSLDTKALPIPEEIFKTLSMGFLSPHRKSNTLIISGEGGLGKFDLACQIALLLRSQSTKACSSIIEISGHTKERMESDIIDVAKKLGMKDTDATITNAKNFLRTELFKKHRTVIIVRCLRTEAIVDGIYPMQDVANGFLFGKITPRASIIYTTGQSELLTQEKSQNFYQISLDQSYAVDDLHTLVKSQPEGSPFRNKINTGMLPFFVNSILKNNPAYARLAIPYLKNTSTTLYEYIRQVQNHGDEGILTCSLRAIQDPLAYTLLSKIAALPQKSISIDTLVNDVNPQSSIDILATYQNVTMALLQLEKFSLIRIDAKNNCVYPLILVRHTSALQKVCADHQLQAPTSSRIKAPETSSISDNPELTETNPSRLTR